MPDEQKPRMEKLIDGKVQVRKKSTGRKLMEVFFSDEIPNLGDYLMFDLLVPAIKDTVVNIFTSGIEMLFYGKAKGGRRVVGRNGSTVVTYDQFSKNGGIMAQRSARQSVYDVMDVVFEDRGAAELILDQLIDYIDRYNRATVHDFYDACGVTTTNYNDDYYGWKDLRGAIVTRARGGWVINMPDPIQIR